LISSVVSCTTNLLLSSLPLIILSGSCWWAHVLMCLSMIVLPCILSPSVELARHSNVSSFMKLWR
jgi:hypothetical protein